MGTPRDFLDDSYSPVSSKRQPRDFLDNGQEEETLGQSALYAPLRVGEDLTNAAWQGIQNAPEYWEKAKTEVPGFLNPMNFMAHPVERGKQSLAGLLELGQKINHAPRGIAQYAANRLHLIPQSWADKVPQAPDLDQDIEKYLGSPKYPGDSLSRGLARNLDSVVPGVKLATKLNPLNLTAKSIAKDIVKTREKNIGRYTDRYNNLWRDAEKKGFENALYDIDMDIPSITKYSPKKSIKGVLDFDANPTLENAHSALSDLKGIKRNLDKLTTMKTAERQQLKAVNDAMKSIDSNMFKGPNGLKDEALSKLYKDISAGYAEEVIPYKQQMVGKYMRKKATPERLINALNSSDDYMYLSGAHPSLKYRNALKKHPYLWGLGTGSALGTGAAELYGELFGKHDK